MGLLYRRNRRKKGHGRRLEMPKLAWSRAARALGAIAAIAAVGILLALGLDQPVRSFVIDGPFQRVTAVEVQQAALGALRGGFVSADLDLLRKAVEGLVWVDRARVQRLWPDRLRIEIVEQQAAARWGDDSLLNTRGELFATGVRHLPPELPRLDGPEGTEWQVAQRYLAMQDRLGKLGFQVAALRLDRARRVGARPFDRRHRAPRAPPGRRADGPLRAVRRAGDLGPCGRGPLRRHALLERIRDRLAGQPQAGGRANCPHGGPDERRSRLRWLNAPTAT
jgi:cell division protein FtsQ